MFLGEKREHDHQLARHGLRSEPFQRSLLVSESDSLRSHHLQVPAAGVAAERADGHRVQPQQQDEPAVPDGDRLLLSGKRISPPNSSLKFFF